MTRVKWVSSPFSLSLSLSLSLSARVLIVCRNRHTGNKGGMEKDFVQEKEREKTRKEGCLHKAQEDAASDEKVSTSQEAKKIRERK